MVPLYERAKLYVIIFASRTRHPFLIIEVAGDWHTKHTWLRMNPCERAQEQFQIDPAGDAFMSFRNVTSPRTRACFFFKLEAIVTLSASVVLVRRRSQ